MSGRRKSPKIDGGCGAALLVVGAVVTPIAYALEFIFKNIGIIILSLAIVSVCVGIVFLFRSLFQQRKNRQEERKHYEIIAQAPEKAPTLFPISDDPVFANPEEEWLNRDFRAFLRRKNEIIQASAHLGYLESKTKALYFLGRSEEAGQFSESLTQARNALAKVQGPRNITFNSRYCASFYRTPQIKQAYTAFLENLPNERMNPVGDFFQNPQAKVVKLSPTSAWIFTPFYVVVYQGTGKKLQIVTYQEFSLSARITTERLSGRCEAFDEIEHIGYRYETKDGSRDMRYSLANNPSYTYVYRGSITLRMGDVSYEQKFPNKSWTEKFEESWKNFQKLINGLYQPAVEQALNHQKAILQVVHIGNYVAQQAELEAQRQEQEKAERMKREAERKAREEAERMKREAERKAREEAERVKRQEAERKAREEAERIKREAEHRAQKEARFRAQFCVVDGELISWYGSGRTLTIPRGIAPVIGTAFRWKSQLESVALPDDVVRIKAGAFCGSTKLKKLVLPDSVSEIGEGAFEDCRSLEDITLPGSLSCVAESLFKGCTSLQNPVIPAGVKSIQKWAFSGCSALRELVIPEGVEIIGDGAFEDCTSLKKLVLPDSLIKIGDRVFEGCSALEEVVLGRGITCIPKDCFAQRTNLLTVTVAPGLTGIGERAFQNCQRFRRLSYAGGENGGALKTIGKSAFENCFALEGIRLPAGLSTLSDFAFANCHAIREVDIPSSVTRFGQGVFEGCRLLSRVTGTDYVRWQKKRSFLGTPWLSMQADHGFVRFDRYLEAYVGTESVVEIPAGVTEIGPSAFEHNTSVTKVIVPPGVTAIGDRAFANCSQLGIIRLPDSVEQIAEDAFEDDRRLVFQCTRGSAASAFRIRKKIPCEYMTKTREPRRFKPTSPEPVYPPAAGEFAGLSDEERRVILKMRREKQAVQKAEPAAPARPDQNDYVLDAFDESKVTLELQDGKRVITNNIFTLRFRQTSPAGKVAAPAEYETFVIDAKGHMISDIQTIAAGQKEDYKVTCSLTAQEKREKAAPCYVVLRYKGAGNHIVSRTPYQLDIAFASDFDF